MDEENEPSVTPVMYSAGLYFVCDIIINQCGIYRIPFHKSFSENTMLRAYCTNLTEIRSIMGIGDLQVPCRCRNNERTNNRTIRQTIAVNNICAEDCKLPDLNLNNLNINDIEVRDPNAMLMQGEDVDHFHNHGGGNCNQQHQVDEDNAEANSLHVTIQKLLEQFYFNIISESPNKKAAADGT